MYLFGTWLAAYLDWCKARASERPFFWLTLGFAFNFMFMWIAGAVLGVIGVLLWVAVAMAFLPLFFLSMFKIYADKAQSEAERRKLRNVQKLINRSGRSD
ncbi:hypothetical protein [Ruegeria arenilitoris]|uniref:hypothetical protein n=1 Tax=Ruegeria arenilitoris TaxID=1173585 RepID=UPI003C7D4181